MRYTRGTTHHERVVGSMTAPFLTVEVPAPAAIFRDEAFCSMLANGGQND